MTTRSLAKAFAGMAKTIRRYEPKIGQAMSVDQLDKEMGAEFMSALIEAGAEPTVTVRQVAPAAEK